MAGSHIVAPLRSLCFEQCRSIWLPNSSFFVLVITLSISLVFLHVNCIAVGMLVILLMECARRVEDKYFAFSPDIILDRQCSSTMVYAIIVAIVFIAYFISMSTQIILS